MKTDKLKHIQGYWWNPLREEKRASGRLFIPESGMATLKVFGNFIEFHTIMDAPIRFYGFTSIGEITLDDCFLLERKVSQHGILEETYGVNLALVGAHIKVAEPFHCSEVLFSFEGLEKWYGTTGISIKDKGEGRKTIIEYTPPNPKNYNIKDGNVLSLEVHSVIPFGYSRASHVKIDESTFIRLIFKNPVDTAKLQKIIGQINNFFCLAYGQPTALTFVTAFSVDYVKETKGKDQAEELKIRLFYDSLPRSEGRSKIYLPKMLIRYANVASNLDSILSAWLDKYEQLEPVFNSFFSYAYLNTLYTDSKFLAFVQGLETLHRRTNDEKPMGEEEYNRLVSALVEACPQERKNWLKDRLRYGNDLSLRYRLSKLLSPFTEIFGDPQNIKKLINDIVNTRNYLTHFDKNLESKAKVGFSILNLSNKVEILYEIHLLRLCGFSNQKIISILGGNPYITPKLKEGV